MSTYLWEATLKELVVEIVTRKTDNGNNYDRGQSLTERARILLDAIKKSVKS